MDVNVNARNQLLIGIDSGDFTEYLNLSNRIMQCMLFNYIIDLLPTFRRKELVKHPPIDTEDPEKKELDNHEYYKSKLVGLFKNSMIYSPIRTIRKLITRDNRGRIIENLKAFQVLMLMEEYNSLLELPDCDVELEDIRNLLNNLTVNQLEILYIRYPNHYGLRNYLYTERNWSCRNNKCAAASKRQRGPQNRAFGGFGSVFGQDDTPENPEETMRQRAQNCNLTRM